MAMLAEFTNEIYDTSTAAFADQGDSTKVFLGVLVTLLPKVSFFAISILEIQRNPVFAWKSHAFHLF